MSLWGSFGSILHQGALGAIVGYGTNWLAIRLLFQPYKRIRLGPFGFGPGVFIQHQDKLAREVSRIAAESILTVEALRKRLEGEQLRQYFMVQIRSFLAEQMTREYGPVTEIIPKELQRDYRELVLFARGKLRDGVRGYIASPGFEKLLSGIVSDQLEYFGRFPLSEILDSERRANISRFAHRVLVARLSAPETREDIKRFTDGLLREFFSRREPLRELLPVAFSTGLAEKLEPYIQEVLQKATAGADMAPMVAEIRKGMKTLLDRFLNSDRNWVDRIANWAIRGIKGDQIEKAVEEFAESFPEWIVQYLTSKDGSHHASEYAARALNMLLDTSPAEISSRLSEPSMLQLREAVADLVASGLQSEQVSEMIVEYISLTVSGMKDERLEDIVRKSGLVVPHELYEMAGSVVVEKVRSPEATDRLLSRASVVFRELLERPIGRPDRFIPPQAIDTMSSFINRTMFDYLSQHSAEIIRSLDIEGTIYRKISTWEPRELHNMVNRAARENLRWLEILGGIIGFVAGALSGALALLF